MLHRAGNLEPVNMNLFSDIHTRVIEALDVLVRAGDLPEGLDFANATVEPPRDPLHGDMATNAAMVLAKPSGQKPRDIALKLAEQLMSDGRITAADVAGPGFLNLRLANDVWQGLIGQVLNMGQQYGTSSMGIGKKVNVEFVVEGGHELILCGR